MKIKTTELTGPALDWAVAKCEYDELAAARIQWPQYTKHFPLVSPSTDWSQGGPIIERERLGVGYTTEGGATWLAARTDDPFYISGPTPLVAAMRCFVASQLGDEVEVPDELL